MAEQSAQGKAVASGSEAADHTHSALSQKRVMAELFTGMGVAEVQFHIGDRDTSQGITDGDGRVGVGPGVDLDSIAAAHGLVNPVHQSTFEIALKAVQLH